MAQACMNAAFSCRSDTLSYKLDYEAEALAIEAVGTTGIAMLKTFAATFALLAMGASAHAASAVNLDSEPRTLIVTEGGSKSELSLGGNETLDFCPSGCFVTMPNGDIEALTGGETIEISGGVARIK
jgi:hypothetical protein